MKWRKWEDLPPQMQTEEVRPYYELLSRKRGTLAAKRAFDIIGSLALLVPLSPVLLGLAIAIKLDSKGPVFFRQTRVTQYGQEFRIFKFRTMVDHAEQLGSSVTVGNDSRVTRVGRFARKYRLDELSQLFDVLRGTMTFVGTRPEVPKYVKEYTPEMWATLLLPAGVTSEAAILYKDEANLLRSEDNIDTIYINKVLAEKMKINIGSVKNFSCSRDILTMLRTVEAVLGGK